MMGGCVVGIKLYGSPKFSIGGFPIPVENFQAEGQRIVQEVGQKPASRRSELKQRPVTPHVLQEDFGPVIRLEKPERHSAMAAPEVFISLDSANDGYRAVITKARRGRNSLLCSLKLLYFLGRDSGGTRPATR